MLPLIVRRLDALDVNMQLTGVDPLAYANAGDATLICDFDVVISVIPNSLAQADAAGVVAPTVLAVLEEAGISDAQVAVVEANHCRQSKFMPFDPNSELESISILRKPFTFTLSLSIAPHAMPRYEGTGGVFIRLSTDDNDKRVYLLTCAHVARPPPEFENVAYTRKYTSQPLEKFVLHGTDSYANALGDITKFIDDETMGITVLCGNVTAVDWQKYMFPQHHDHRDFHVPEDLLLQLEDYVREDEFRNPKNRDVNDVDTLLDVKNGHITGTTFGRVNGLDSITRTYDAHGLKVDAKEVLILGYDTKTGKNERFSEGGDSGSIVVDRRGRLIGLLTGGKGSTSATDQSYVTPYYRLKEKIEAKFDGAHLLPANFDFLFA
ncbi:hypothetical protein K525DRAFT_270633 [Schizophyllum commune Loenen D]|nr:hypothetical protein K525DRAFT_270633 [Schizophyllum commune Loenen D]